MFSIIQESLTTEDVELLLRRMSAQYALQITEGGYRFVYQDPFTGKASPLEAN